MKVVHCAAVGFFLTACLSVQAVVYVDDDAAEGGDGLSWATAFRDIPEAVAMANTLADTSQRIIFVAKGVYPVVTAGQASWCVLEDKVRIYGGFAGTETGTVEQMLASRDVDENQSIVTGDKDRKNDVWISTSHALTEWDFPVAETTTMPIVDFETKTVNVPATDGTLVTYDYKFDYNNQYNNSWLDINTGCSATVDGFWFTSQNASWGGAVRVLGGSAQQDPCHVNNCRFYGFRATCYKEKDAHSNCDNYLTNCKFFGGTVAPVAFNSSLIVSNCSFQAISMGTVNRGGLIACAGSCGTIVDCAFTQCAVRNGSATDRQALLFGGQWGLCDFRRSVVSNCLAIAASTGKVGLFGCGESVVEKSLFVNNRQNSRVSGGAVVSMVVAANGRSTAHNDRVAVDGCAFVSNTLHAAAANDYHAGECYLGILGSSSYTKNDTAVVNSSFFDNVVDLEPAEELTAVRSRGVLADATVAEMGAMGVVNCAFAGSAAPGVFDVLQQGVANARPLYIVNSLFMTEAEKADPFRFSSPTTVAIDSCTVKRGSAPADVAACSGFSSQEVPLALQSSPSGCPLALRPVVKTPEARLTADVGLVDDARGIRTFAFLPVGTSVWRPLLPHQTTKTGVTRNLDDAFGVTRPAGLMTRGPVQTLSETAESGVSFSVVCEPIGFGTTAGDAVQSVQPGQAPNPVTAVAGSGASFVGWFEVGSETPLSTSPILNYPVLSDHTTVIAKFGTPEIDLTFDLGSAGTFSENGATSIVKKVSAGTLPVPVPPYVLAEKMIDLGWTPSTNVVSPSVATTFRLKTVTTDLRSVYVVPGGAGRKDGTDWANAYGDLSAAWSDAGIYRGELQVKGGTYVVPNGLMPLGNVRLCGSVDGVPTVIKGSSVDYLLVASANSAVTNIVFENVTFDSFRYGVADLSAYRNSTISFLDCTFTNNNTSSSGTVVNTGGSSWFKNCRVLSNFHFFYAAQDNTAGAAHTNVFEGCVFDSNSGSGGGGACVAAFGAHDVTVTNCTFRNNSTTTSYQWSQACVLMYGASGKICDSLFEANQVRDFCDGVIWTGATVERCRFIGNVALPNRSCSLTACVNLSGDGAVVRDCLFASNVVTAVRTGSGTNVISVAVRHPQTGRACVYNSSFVDNCIEGNLDESDTAGVVVGAAGRWSDGLGVAHCAFRGNKLPVGGTNRKGVIAVARWTGAGGGVGLANCAVAKGDSAAAFYCPASAQPMVFTCALGGDDGNPVPAFRDELVCEGPDLVPQLMLSGDTSFARRGVPVYLANMFLYAYVPEHDAKKPYIQLPSPLEQKSATLAVEAPIPDAFGAPRRRKICYGPVNLSPLGLLIILR